jgi:AraC family transcriptional regulator
MLSQRILKRYVETNKLVPINAASSLSEPLLVSVGACWNDILKVEHHCLPPGEMSLAIVLDHVLVFHARSSSVILDLQIAGQQPLHKPVEFGDLHLLTQGTSICGRWHEEVEILVLALNPHFVVQAAQELAAGERIEFINLQAFQDLQLQQLMLTLKAELETDCPGGRFFGETIGIGLVIQMLKKYNAFAPKYQSCAGGLSPLKLSKVLEYVNTHLDEDITLTTLAELVHITPYYFCRLFKQSMGIAPHQYLMQRRLEQAKVLLRQQPDTNIADIALQCGFTNQSHLSRHFRLQMGITPKQYRRQM